MSAAEVDVVIAGAGPVGATLALLLARHGVRTVVLEKRAEPQAHPAAHVLSTRTMEIWREIGLERAIRSASARLHELRYVLYCTTLRGLELGRLDLMEADPGGLERLEAQSPTRIAHLSQRRLEPILWGRLAASPEVDFREGVALASHAQLEGGVRVTAGDGSVVHARYLVAADGAGSQVRKALGVAMEGPVLQHVMSVHLSVDLRRYLVTRRGPLVWVHAPRAGLCALILHRPPEDVVLQVPYFPPLEAPEDFTEERCAKLAVAAIGEDVPLAIRSAQPWVMTAQVAARYREGRVFLVGDAAHRFPPTGGLGLNTGAHDAHDLAWRLAWVLRGDAEEALLDSYEVERRPVALRACAHSVENFERMFDVHEALGIPVRGRAALAALGRSRLLRGAHVPAAGRLLRGLMALGLRRLERLEKKGPRAARQRRKVAEAIRGQAPHFRSWGLDLGTTYEAGFVLPEPSSPPLEVERYTPSAHPGRRLPHAFLRHEGRRVSTLDLALPDALALLCTVEGARGWHDQLAALPPAKATRVRVVAVDPRSFERARWEELFGVARDGALLVRPDGHVAFRARDGSALLAPALDALLSPVSAPLEAA